MDKQNVQKEMEPIRLFIIVLHTKTSLQMNGLFLRDLIPNQSSWNLQMKSVICRREQIKGTNSHVLQNSHSVGNKGGGARLQEEHNPLPT